MAKSEIKHPHKRVDTGACSAAVEVDGWVFVSGQVPRTYLSYRPLLSRFRAASLRGRVVPSAGLIAQVKCTEFPSGCRATSSIQISESVSSTTFH